ncbi:MAG: SDR family oxidoreductase [Candidatus Latescibacteria bacterium]|jgi:3-oxoacyl-[acyl-carrier protein] reductase|nr:SDR family oxidoreductase [Candidatus Latescibacterota bacterium]
MPDADKAERLTDKVAVVTGGGRGIGRAIALALAREGADICVVARTESQIGSVSEEIRDLGRKALAVSADVTDQEQVEAMAKAVRDAFGRVDILVNDAGGGIEPKPVLESDPDLWVKDVEVNLIGAYRVTRSLLPLMVSAGGGRIINLGSGMGHQSGAGSSAYRIGKAGLWMLTRCLGEELWEQGIEVNELIPGPVETDLTRPRMTAGGPPPFAPSERVKLPDEVVPLALYLATQPPGGPTAQSFSLTRRPI